MHQEYAVEPSAIATDWNTFRYLIEKFGLDRGRLISRFPGKWEKKVIQEAKRNGMQEVKLASLIERMRKVHNKLINNHRREYHSDEDWIDNAIREHAKEPFQVIIQSGSSRSDQCCLIVADLDNENELDRAYQSCNVPRTSEEIATALLPLAIAGREIDIVDPYFELLPREGDYLGPLSSLFGLLVRSGCPGKTIRIHWRWHPERRPDSARYTELLPAHTNELVPVGYTLQLHQWAEKNSGEDFHDRFFLTDCGGITSGAGFSAVGSHQTVTMSLLDDATARDLQSRLEPGANVYDLIGQIMQINADGSIELI